MTAVCDECLPVADCYFDQTQVAKLTGLDEATLGMAMRLGTLPVPSARTIHNQPLWPVDAVHAYLHRVRK